jgi:hypothetical protein
MEIKERKQLRLAKLKELYDFNINHAGRDAQISYQDLRDNKEDKEEHLAYEYLTEKGLINYKIMARNMYSAKITAYGIDYIENEEE